MVSNELKVERGTWKKRKIKKEHDRNGPKCYEFGADTPYKWARFEGGATTALEYRRSSTRCTGFGPTYNHILLVSKYV